MSMSCFRRDTSFEILIRLFDQDKVRDQIKVSEGGGSANDRRRDLKAELAQTRSKLDESRGLQDTIAKKVIRQY